jgi:ADP-heptose:LPS heptosyltransferase
VKSPSLPGLLDRLEGVHKVVLFRASRIGDFLCATPAFRAIRLRLPEAQITLVGLPFVREICRRSPCLDRFVPFCGFPGIAEQFFDARRARRFFGRLQSERFDLAVQMHGSGVYSNTVALMFGARATAGFVREGDGPGRLDAALTMPSCGHEAKRLLSLATFLGTPDPGTETEFPLTVADRERADALLRGKDRPLIGIHVWARKAEKRWPIDRFVETARQLRGQFGGTVVVLGGREDLPTGKGLVRDVGHPCLDLTGRTTVPVLGAVLGCLSVLLTNDSGPAHVAYALKCPTVTIFGETDPVRWGPGSPGPFRAVRRVLPCSPCPEDSCGSDYACLRSLTVEQVVNAARQVMKP